MKQSTMETETVGIQIASIGEEGCMMARESVQEAVILVQGAKI